MSLFKTKRTHRGLFREGVLGSIDISEFIIIFSYAFPMDKIFREKHNIPFGSLVHKHTDPIDMVTELALDSAVNKAVEDEIEKKKNPAVKYFGGRGKYFKTSRKVEALSQGEIDEAFDNIDTDDIKVNDDGTISI